MQTCGMCLLQVSCFVQLYSTAVDTALKKSLRKLDCRYVCKIITLIGFNDFNDVLALSTFLETKCLAKLEQGAIKEHFALKNVFLRH